MTENTDNSVVWMTQDGFDKLTEDLEELRGPKRGDIVARIAAARDEGDLKENGGYHAAREEQGKLESQIRQLEDTLRRAQVGETPLDDGVVEPGMDVLVRFADGHEQEFLLGAREMAAASSRDDLQVYTPQSPLGTAINGKRVGDEVDFTGPTGKVLKVTIVSATPFTG